MKRISLKGRLIGKIIGVLTGWFLVLTFLSVFTPYQIVGNGMQNTLNDGQPIWVNKVVYFFYEPERGDVVVLHGPTDTNREWAKRIIGLPGDIITLSRSSVSVNGVQLIEPNPTSQQNITQSLKQSKYRLASILCWGIIGV